MKSWASSLLRKHNWGNLEKLAKKFQQLGPVIEGINGEFDKLRDELEQERQTKARIMTWIKDHLGPNLELIDSGVRNESGCRCNETTIQTSENN